MNELPTGTVTFLFTDIEGSTQLLHRLGAGYRPVQDRHADIMRASIADQHGEEIRTEGDSFFVVFRTPGQAVRAAVAAQRALAGSLWSGDARPRVRMGLHTGEGILGGDDYIGLDVNLAARIAAAAHGGQILLSDSTRALVANDLPEGIRIRSLGSYRLKGFPAAERLHQLEIHGLPATFPALRALDVRRAHLPQEATTFVGRGAEIDTLGRLLAERRLVTLTGPGGSGKTRLALRIASDQADRFDDGAFFVPLSSVRHASRVPSAIASELDLLDDGSRPILDVVVDWIRDRDVLLVLDNLEQIDRIAAAVEGLLAASERTHVIATSRSPLGVAGEQELLVPPFPVPTGTAAPGDLADSDVVRLFIDRVRLVRPDFEPTDHELSTIAEICARLEGLPLAVELAAARVRLLPVAAIREHLGRRLDLQGGPSSAPERHRGLRKAIAWSHDLLDEPQRGLFRRLSTFVGGLTLEAAEAVAAGEPVVDITEGLEALSLQSLIQGSSVSDEPRFTMLVTIAEFAAERLEASGEGPEIRRRYRAYFRALAEDVLERSTGPARDVAFDRAERDLDNLRNAIEIALVDGDPAQALAIAAALRPFWLQRNQTAEGLRLLVDLSERADAPPGPGFAAATASAAAIATWLGEYGVGRQMGLLSVEAYRELGDRWALAEALGSYAFSMIETDVDAALSLNKESLTIYRELGDVRGEGQALLGRATARFAQGRLVDTRELLRASHERLVEAEDHYFAVFCSVFHGRVDLLMGDIVAGLDAYRAVLETSQRLNLRLGIAVGLDYFAEVAIWSGDVERAVRLGAAAERLKEELGGGVPPRMGGAPDPLDVGRRELATAAFDREIEAGRAMEADVAIAEALDTAPPPSVPSS